MSKPVIIGLDPSTKRFAYGVIDLDGKPIEADFSDLERGWLHQRIGEEIGVLAARTDWDVRGIHCERPRGGGRQGAGGVEYSAGITVGLAEYRFPGRAWAWSPSEWKKALGLKGNCPKSDIAEACIEWAEEEHFDLAHERTLKKQEQKDELCQDTIDALMIARSGLILSTPQTE